MNELKAIKKAVNHALQMDIATDTNKEEYVWGRSIYYKLCKEYTNCNHVEISKEVGRNRACVNHAMNNFQRDILKDKKYNRIYVGLLESLAPEIQQLQAEELTRREMMEDEIKGLKLQNELLHLKLKKSISVENNEEIRLINLWRSLDQEGRKDAIFKIETAKKVRERMREQTREQKRQTA